MAYLSCDKLVYLLHEEKNHTGYVPSTFTTQAWLKEGSFFSRKPEMLLSVVLQPPKGRVEVGETLYLQQAPVTPEGTH